MRKNIKRIMSVVTSLALAATMLVGMGASQVKADGENLLTGSWTHIHEAYEANDALIENTRVTNTADGFTANISITGWQRNWYGVDYMPDDAWPYADGWADNPYQLRSYTMLDVTPKSTYQLSFDVQNEMTSEVGNPTEKNVTITVDSGIDGDTDNTFLFTTVRVSANGTFKFDRKFTIPEDYSGSNVMIEIAYGSYAYSYEVSASSMIKLMPADVIEKYCFAPGTSEDVNAGGKLAFSNMNLVQVEYEEPTTKAPTTEKPTGGNTQGQACTCDKTQIKECACSNTTNTQGQACTCDKTTVTTPSVKKPAKATVKKARNLKGKKVKVTWKKVEGATKYQVRAVADKKTVKKTTSKLSYTFKNLKKKKTYKVSVRAYNSAGYGKWSKAKKVKITK